MAHFDIGAGFGVAGNFARHLEQAGELEDFAALPQNDDEAPKGVFPFFLAGRDDFLGVDPLSTDTIRLPEDETLKVQGEPEVALYCTLAYEDGRVAAVVPQAFVPFNDCSIRRPGAKKISEKKNWGRASKGVGTVAVAIDTFAPGGIMDRWHLASFLRRDGVLHRYGEDAPLVTYSYFHERLLDWLTQRLAFQQDEGPLEALSAYLDAAGRPERVLVSIGATRYTEYGETTFLQPGDEMIVVLYDAEHFDADTVMEGIDSGVYAAPGLSVLAQKVVRG